MARTYKRKSNGQFAGGGGGTSRSGKGRAKKSNVTSIPSAPKVAQKRSISTNPPAQISSGRPRVRLSTRQKNALVSVAAVGVTKLAFSAVSRGQYKAYKAGEKGSTLASQAKVRNLATKSLNAEMSFNSRRLAR